MNAITNFSKNQALDAPVYTALNAVELTDIDGDSIGFTLSCRNAPHVYITATVQGRPVKGCTIFGDYDPENDISVDFYSLEVHHDSRPIVIDFDNVFAAHGLQLQLTDKQMHVLNGQIQDLLEERFRKCYEKHNNEMAEYYSYAHLV